MMSMFNLKHAYLSVFVGINFLMLVGCESSNNSSGVNSQQEFLPVEEAFVFSAKADNGQLLKATWEIAEGYHLYKDKFKFSVTPDNYKIVNVKYPKAEMFDDKFLGQLESYKDSVEISIEITGEPNTSNIQLTSVYQGCADVGLCYPPETKKTEFKLAGL